MRKLCFIAAWLTAITVLSEGTYNQLQVDQVFTKTGILNLKLSNNLFIVNKFVLVPISWNPETLLNMYVNVSNSLDSLLHINNTLTSSLQRGLMEIKNVIKSKTEQDLSFVKNYIAAGLLKNETEHSVVIGDRVKRQLGLMGLISNLIVSGVEEIQISKLQSLVSELQSEGKRNFREIGIIKHVTKLQTHKIEGIDNSLIKLAKMTHMLEQKVNLAGNNILNELEQLKIQNFILEIKLEILRINVLGLSLKEELCNLFNGHISSTLLSEEFKLTLVNLLMAEATSFMWPRSNCSLFLTS